MNKAQEVRRREKAILKEFNSNFQFGYKDGTTIKNGPELLKFLISSNDENINHTKSRLERADAHLLSALCYELLYILLQIFRF